MAYQKLIFSIILILAVRFLYEKWESKDKLNKNSIDYDLVRKYLLDENSLGKVTKPILWIHITHDINARSWDNFYSRNTYKLNQDYLYLTIKSIIDHCGDYFHVCLIDDNALQKLLPDWNVNLISIPDPIREHLRKLALSKILYNYGGLLVPASFICFNCFEPYFSNLEENKILVGEFLNRNEGILKYYPNSRLLGCKKNCPIMHKYCQYLEYLNSTNYTSSFDFENLANTWFYHHLNDVDIISSKTLGCKDVYNASINIDRLISNNYIKLCASTIGLYIPDDELLKRTAYNWFIYLTPEEILTSNTQIGKYLLLSQE